MLGVGCASRLSPRLTASPATTGLVALECYLYPEDPEHVRSRFAAPDSFPARVAYLETTAGEPRSFRGISVYGTGLVLFSKLPPGEYRLSGVRVLDIEYSQALLRMVTTELEFRIPESEHLDPIRVETSRPLYAGHLAIHRVTTQEDVVHSPPGAPERRAGAVRLDLRRTDEDEARAWQGVLAKKGYRRSEWGKSIQVRLAELRK
jgi:hypothetical protein